MYTDHTWSYTYLIIHRFIKKLYFGSHIDIRKERKKLFEKVRARKVTLETYLFRNGSGQNITGLIVIRIMERMGKG